MLTRVFGIFKCCSTVEETKPEPVQVIRVNDLEAQRNWNGERYRMVILPPSPPLERVQSTSHSPKKGS